MSKNNKKEPKLKKFVVLREGRVPYWADGQASLDVLKEYQEEFPLDEDEEIEILEIVSWELFTTQKDITFKKEDEWKK